MILSVRYVRAPRRRYVCDWCERAIFGPLIYLYGMAEIGQRPYPLRYCIRCCQEQMQPCDKKFQAAIALADRQEQHR